MNNYGDKPYLLALLFIGMIALSASLWWISDLTAGPAYGGRYDLPAVNGAAWFGFVISIPAVVIMGGFWLGCLEERVDSRRRRRDAGDA